jgi:NAD(P)-dependent dehydrogenase (short-subunit alcohol dehydrogenase family)
MMIETRFLDALISEHTQDMSGKLVAITGTTTGIGYVCAREIAKLGAEVLLLNRDSERAEKALLSLRTDVPKAVFVPFSCDLQRFDSVRTAIKDIQSSYEVLDVLCNNAGVMALEDLATPDGYDVQMQTNCLSHFLLTKDLFPMLLKSQDGRVVNQTSMARVGDPLDASYFSKRGGDLGGNGTVEEASLYAGPKWQRYHQTKLANCAFSFGLKQRLDAAGIGNVNALLAHPGLAMTNLVSTASTNGEIGSAGALWKHAQSAEDGALGALRACIDPKAKSGDFFGPKQLTGFAEHLEPEELLLDAENLRINWEGCEAAVGAFDL